jgi:hypothetical protein
VDSKNPGNRRKTTTGFALVSVMALSACWSASASARTQTDKDCDAVARGLQRLEAPLETLIVSTVDHVTVDVSQADLEAVNEFEVVSIESISGDSAAPVLYLTPRVADALRDIFDSGQEVRAADKMIDRSSSPIAETEEPADNAEVADEARPAPEGQQEIYLPLLQRQMYRTDI